MTDPDFQATTRLLLADIASQRPSPQVIPFTKNSLLSHEALALHSQSNAKEDVQNPMQHMKRREGKAGPDGVIKYPFNMLLTSATIPSSLSTYLHTTHPSLVRLESDHVHRLPSGLKLKYVPWSGSGDGGRRRDVERALRDVWAEDANKAMGKPESLSKVIIFVNRSSKVVELGKLLFALQWRMLIILRSL